MKKIVHLLFLFTLVILNTSVIGMEDTAGEEDLGLKNKKIFSVLFDEKSKLTDHQRIVAFIDLFFDREVIYKDLDNTNDVHFYWHPKKRIDLTLIDSKNSMKNLLWARKFKQLYEVNYNFETGEHHHEALKLKAKKGCSDSVFMGVFQNNTGQQYMLQVGLAADTLARKNPLDDDELDY